MPGGFPRGIKTEYRSAFAQNLSLFIGRKAPECVSDGADQRVRQKGWLGDGSRPVRLWWLQRTCRRQSIASRGVELRSIARRGGIECIDCRSQTSGANPDLRREFFECLGLI